MYSAVQRLTSNKLLFSAILVLICYALLRIIALFVHQPVLLSGEYFSFNGNQVRYVCKGQGAPYVFFESGYGDDSEAVWSSITEKLPESFTSCYYDRLGHGGSDDIPHNFTTEDKSQVQEALIQQYIVTLFSVLGCATCNLFDFIINFNEEKIYSIRLFIQESLELVTDKNLNLVRLGKCLAGQKLARI